MRNIANATLIGKILKVKYGERVERKTRRLKKHLKASLAVNRSKKLPDGTFTNIPFFMTVILAGFKYRDYHKLFKEGYTIYVYGNFYYEPWTKDDGTVTKELIVLAQEVRLLAKLKRPDSRFGREDYKAAIKEVEEMSAELDPTLADFIEEDYSEESDEGYGY